MGSFDCRPSKAFSIADCSTAHFQEIAGAIREFLNRKVADQASAA
jgi:hypothetical protein